MKKIKSISKGIGIFLLTLFILHILAVPVVYNIYFYRGKSSSTQSYMDYDKYKVEYPREEITYKANGIRYQGYYYPNENSKALVITVHGIKDQADYLLSTDFYFYDQGYSIFSFDLRGCGKSTGHIDGFQSSRSDVIHTVQFLNSEERFQDFKLLLFGFSMGGYGVTSALDEIEVSGVASISGYDDADGLIGNKGKSYVGPLVYLGKPIVAVMEKIKFKDTYGKLSSTAIENSQTPVFLAHGTQDHTISYDTLSIVSKFKNNSRVICYTEDATHSGILYSKEVYSYQKEVGENGVRDDQRYFEVNPILYQEILSFYEKCIA